MLKRCSPALGFAGVLLSTASTDHAAATYTLSPTEVGGTFQSPAP
jgi:hypothetical protein